MKILATLKEVGAVNEFKVTDSKTGEQKTMKVVGVTFSEGKDVLYGEAKFENADAVIKQQSTAAMNGKLCYIDCNASVRTYQDKEGNERKQTQLTITNIQPCW